MKAKKKKDERPVESSERTIFDVYPTPIPVAAAICDRLIQYFPNPQYIIEPSAGWGVFVREARRVWGPTIHIHANEIRGEEAQNLINSGASNVSHRDWAELIRSWKPAGQPLILGNPPFSLATEHIAAIMESCEKGTTAAFLLKQNLLGGVDRAKNFWPKHPYKFKIPLVPRPSFKKTAKASNDTNEYAVFFWEVGYVGPSVTVFPHIIWRQ